MLLCIYQDWFLCSSESGLLQSFFHLLNSQRPLLSLSAKKQTNNKSNADGRKVLVVTTKSQWSEINKKTKLAGGKQFHYLDDQVRKRKGRNVRCCGIFMGESGDALRKRARETEGRLV